MKRQDAIEYFQGRIEKDAMDEDVRHVFSGILFYVS